jgi:hypothetical protein
MECPSLKFIDFFGGKDNDGDDDVVNHDAAPSPQLGAS